MPAAASSVTLTSTCCRVAQAKLKQHAHMVDDLTQRDKLLKSPVLRMSHVQNCTYWRRYRAMCMMLRRFRIRMAWQQPVCREFYSKLGAQAGVPARDWPYFAPVDVQSAEFSVKERARVKSRGTGDRGFARILRQRRQKQCDRAIFSYGLVQWRNLQLQTET